MLLAACASAPGRRVPTSETVRAAPDAPAAAMVHHARTEIVDRATAMLGQPYRYGGAAPGGFDCSGLVAYAADGAGLRVPRTAREQLHAGVPITRGDVQAGDLVFMRLSRKELHVGIALDGLRFIHAPAAGRRVRIDSLDASPYSRAFVGARRIVPG
jgi:cell wall-associated NlpC family hydrolase